ncbi:LysE family translocator [Nocardioides sp. CFH 31398]|uniref:LysE family translocator n=1 Tax=Nocardioides sp. CFH 31398 TaxID=2919579 RepID=UPI001F059FC0|nr:LysE family translocator [Nocardioides sp. CFH 31398]MCH1868658.1 LysE family translocator [Nocardioides sp. CFH 31398]
MSAASWTAFLLTATVIVVTPGTGSLYTVATGLARGTRAALLAAVACTLGVLPHLLAAVTGLAALLHASGVAFAVLKYLGVAYLLWMAWATWRGRREPLEVDADRRPGGTRQVLVSGVTLNLLNPKLTLFFFAFLPQFVPAGTPGAAGRILLLGGVFAALTLVVFAAYGALAAGLRARVLARPRLVERLRAAFAASFAVLAGRLALETR